VYISMMFMREKIEQEAAIEGLKQRDQKTRLIVKKTEAENLRLELELLR